MNNTPHSLTSQNGAVLAISLIILLLLTLIGVTASQMTGLEEKMAGNMRERNTAFQAAETALRAGEALLSTATVPTFTTDGSNGYYNEFGTPPSASDNWSSFTTVTYTTASLPHTYAQPQMVLQRLNTLTSSSIDASNYNQNEVYQITARAVGGTDSTVVVVQSDFIR